MSDGGVRKAAVAAALAFLASFPAVAGAAVGPTAAAAEVAEAVSTRTTAGSPARVILQRFEFQTGDETALSRLRAYEWEFETALASHPGVVLHRSPPADFEVLGSAFFSGGSHRLGLRLYESSTGRLVGRWLVPLGESPAPGAVAGPPAQEAPRREAIRRPEIWAAGGLKLSERGEDTFYAELRRRSGWWDAGLQISKRRTEGTYVQALNPPFSPSGRRTRTLKTLALTPFARARFGFRNVGHERVVKVPVNGAVFGGGGLSLVRVDEFAGEDAVGFQAPPNHRAWRLRPVLLFGTELNLSRFLVVEAALDYSVIRERIGPAEIPAGGLSARIGLGLKVF